MSRKRKRYTGGPWAYGYEGGNGRPIKRGKPAGGRYVTPYSTLRRRRMSRVKTKYVDGYYDILALHELSNTADDDWSSCECNPRQVTAVYGCLPVPRVGDGFSDRDDRKVKITKIKLKGFIRWNAVNDLTAASGAQSVRLVIVKDTRTNGATLNAEDVIGAGNGSDGNAALSGNGGAINMFSKPTGWGRYEIMKDILFDPPTQPMSFDGTNMELNELDTHFKITIRPNCEVNFTGTAGDVSTIIDNSFHVLCAKGGDLGSAALCYYARTTFIDY